METNSFVLQVTMAKEEGVKTVVVGGSNDVQQQYCGTVGGQSTAFAIIDTEIKVCILEIVNNFIILSMPRDRAPISRIIHSPHLICTSSSHSPLYHSGALRLIHLSRRLVNAVQGITWRLAFGVDDPEQPEGRFLFSCTSGAMSPGLFALLIYFYRMARPPS